MFDSKLENNQYAFYHHHNGNQIRELTYAELAKKIVQSWMNSPGHKTNILEKEYTFLGVGISIIENPYNKDELPFVLATQLFGGN